MSDARNDAALERALKRLPCGSGFVFRHYHLGNEERRARYKTLARLARARGHLVVLAGSPSEARRWGADLAYGRHGHLVPVHSLREIGEAARAAVLLLSPVFPTRSHPSARTLGATRFRLLAAKTYKPVVALGGMTSRRAKALKWPRWAGIDAFLR